MSSELSFRCRASVRNLGLVWPLARLTLQQNAMIVDAPEVGKVLRRLGVRLPLEVTFDEIVSVRQSADRTLEVRFAGEAERRELRAIAASTFGSSLTTAAG